MCDPYNRLYRSVGVYLTFLYLHRLMYIDLIEVKDYTTDFVICQPP